MVRDFFLYSSLAEMYIPEQSSPWWNLTIQFCDFGKMADLSATE
jgi:hypothetical protein